MIEKNKIMSREILAKVSVITLNVKALNIPVTEHASRLDSFN